MASDAQIPQHLAGRRVAFVGRLASMSKRDAGQLVRRHGGVVLDQPDGTADLAVVGDEDLPLPGGADLDDWFDQSAREAIEAGRLKVVSETDLWRELGLIDQEPEIQQLYTPAMLAELLGVPVSVVRRWHRRGLVVPVREVRRLPYFDFREVAAARRLAELLAAGMSPAAIEKKLAALARYLPGVARPLAQLSVIVEGKEILLRQGDGLIEPGGQLRFDFEAGPDEAPPVIETPEAAEAPGEQAALVGGRVPQAAPPPASIAVPTTPEQMCRLAAELEDDGQLAAAAEMYRAALAAGGPTPEVCFQLAELLYRLGDVAAARERYYMAIELDEDYVEARANLGCVLAETGQRDLAAAAFEGALAYHPDYADVHYHLARLLDESGDVERAAEHWRAFLDLSPDSPWAEEARRRLTQA